MSKKRETRLRGPWEGIHSAIWIIGLAILFLTGYWWPGILFLVAASLLVQSVIQIAVPDAVETVEGEDKDERSAGPVAEPATILPLQTVPPAAQAYPVQRLPSECPKCGGPIRSHEVHWTGPESAGCPFCGANLPLKNG